jgi:hypothetical protein
MATVPKKVQSETEEETNASPRGKPTLYIVDNDQRVTHGTVFVRNLALVAACYITLKQPERRSQVVGTCRQIYKHASIRTQGKNETS